VSFNDLILDEQASRSAAEFVRSKIRETVTDPAVAERLLPGDHPVGTKRIGVGNAYYETYNRDNVRLVDARDAAIERLTPKGIMLNTGEEVELDVIVFATGYESFTGAMTRVDIRGRHGLSLAEKWVDGALTYLGLGVHGFPNLFMVGGPGSPSVLSNAPVSSEAAGLWISDLLAHARDEHIAEIEPEAEAEAAWTRHLREVADMTLHRLTRTSWYTGGNTPGREPIFMAYAGGVNVYNARVAEITAAGYEGFALRPSVTAA
jgi:cation diffusion facilitator CzcD-associated flavoprotein CzcO